jgi:gliding motility-associated lipoprotein GldD
MKRTVLFSLIIFTIIGCGDNFLPKPIGYFRIDLPEKEYRAQDNLPFPFKFELPQYAFSNLERTKSEPNYLNIDFPRYDARIHMSYIPVDTNIAVLLEDARGLVFKHVSKAQDIKESLIINKEDRVFGTLYHIAGDAASGSQFYITDSTNHFVRGALYFNVQPNFDSIAPVQDFLMKDIDQMLETFKWKSQ